ncbi:MAG: TrmH family RNA methyltransferase [Caldilineaceae bacterium]
MTQYAICECSNPACRLRYPAGRQDNAYARCPACHAPVSHCYELVAQAEEQPEAKPALPPAGLMALVDNVRSVFNVGSIFRSADGAGFDRLYLCGVTPTPANPKLAKTALGAHIAIQWEAWPNAVDLARRLQAEGCHLWAMEEGAGAEPLLQAPPPPPNMVLVVGSEVTGVDPGLLSLCERTLAIPMRGAKRSLNVATAFGIAALILASRLRPDSPEETGVRPA